MADGAAEKANATAIMLLLLPSPRRMMMVNFKLRIVHWPMFVIKVVRAKTKKIMKRNIQK